MALSPNLPPQAYTRDTLVKAIEWMSTQPVAMRERANSADLIVSHYLASRRRMPYPSELPSTDFKAIADSLKALEDMDLPLAPESVVPDPEPVAPPRPPRRRETPRGSMATYAQSAPYAPAAVASTAPPVAEPRPEVGPARGQPETEFSVQGLTWTVDQRSRTTITYPNESPAYRAARNRLLAREIELRREMEAVAAALRALPPGGPVPEDYPFERLTPDGTTGTVRLSELFEGGDTLMITTICSRVRRRTVGPARRRAPRPSCRSPKALALRAPR